MTTQTMIEKLVDAMQSVPHYGEPGTEDFTNFARAALQALREPTAINRLSLEAFADGENETYAEDFIAMIDAALQEKAPQHIAPEEKRDTTA